MSDASRLPAGRKTDVAKYVVARGQVIGALVAGHRSDGVDALHWGARTGPKSYVNPLRLLRPAVIRLKPLEDGG